MSAPIEKCLSNQSDLAKTANSEQQTLFCECPTSITRSTKARSIAVDLGPLVHTHGSAEFGNITYIVVYSSGSLGITIYCGLTCAHQVN